MAPIAPAGTSGGSASAPAPFNLPAAPPELCFDKNDFGRRAFSVDEFLQSHRNAATMETMRDDLGVYLKVLRSAMIELINEDYADFVNLAANLRGLDQQIAGIQQPLQLLRADIVAVRTTLTDTMADLTAGMREKRALRNELQSERAAVSMEQRFGNIDALLPLDGGGAAAAAAAAGDEEAAAIDRMTTALERVALEYAQVAFEVQQFGAATTVSDQGEATNHPTTTSSANSPADGNARSAQLNALHRRLLDALGAHFLHAVRACCDDAGTVSRSSGAADRLERCLRIFCTLDECHVAEEIFRKRVVAPHMHAIIAEHALQNSPQGLHGIYAQVLAFIEHRMRPLLVLTATADATTAAKVRGYDFLLRSYWPEVEQRLETHMSSIFAPGNPDQFYHKYESSVEFLRQLERVLGPDAAAFGRTREYRSFQTRWNLPVYFQIRFQEIGGALEQACSRPIGGPATFTSGDRPQQLRLVVIATAVESFRRCWSAGVYLPQIFVRFWKLSLQLLARTARWLDEFVALDEWPAQRSDDPTAVPRTLVAALIVCHREVRASLIAELPALLELVVQQRRRAQQQQQSIADNAATEAEALLGGCLAETRNALEQRLGAIEGRVVGEIVAASAPSIRQVNDIPRLFRKTNRDVPSKAAPYVDQLLRAAVQFAGQHGGDFGDERMRGLLRTVFGQLNAQ